MLIGGGNVRLDEVVQIAAAFAPVDMSASTGPVSDWVSMRKFQRVSVVFIAAAGTAGNDSVLTLKQATDVAGDNPKELNFSRLLVKQGSDLTAIGQFTETDNPNADNTYTSDTSGENQLIWVVDITPDMLDIDGGFTAIQASVNDHGAAKVGTILYLCYNPRYVEAPLASAIVD